MAATTQTRSILIIISEAIRLMHLTQYGLAAELFQQGVRLVEQYVEDYEHGDTIDDDASESEATNRVELFQLDPVCIRIPNHLQALEEMSPLAVYARAMSLYHPSMDSADIDCIFRSEETCALLSCTILYNIGLCYQLCGLGTGRDNHYNQSLVSYGMALGLLDSAVMADCCRVWLELALLNNTGYTHFHFANMKKAQDCLEEMGFLFDLETEGGEFRVRPPLRCLLLNVIMNGSQLVCHAPIA